MMGFNNPYFKENIKNTSGTLVDVEIDILSCFLLLCEPNLFPSSFIIHQLTKVTDKNTIVR